MKRRKVYRIVEMADGDFTAAVVAIAAGVSESYVAKLLCEWRMHGFLSHSRPGPQWAYRYRKTSQFVFLVIPT